MSDLIEFIKKYVEPHRFPYFLPTAREQKISWRIAGYRAWRQRAISFNDFAANLLPGRFKNQDIKDKLQVAVDRDIESAFKNSGIMNQPTTLLGHRFSPTDPSDFRSWLIGVTLVKQIVIDDQYHIKKFIGSDAVVLDAGANIGAFSAFAATQAPNGRIYAFEPTTSTFHALEKNLKSYPNASAIQSALGDRTGTAELLIHKSLDAGNSLEEAGLAPNLTHIFYSGKETVPITTIDAFVREHNLSRVDFIKVDTEGFEKQILEGAADTIKKYRPTIVLAAYHKPEDPERCTDLIKACDESYICELETGPELDLVCHV